MSEPTRTIYNCLTRDFWTQKICRSCYKLFTLVDYQTKNYQLFFKEVLKPNLNSRKNGNCLEVIVQLQHQLCPLTCSFNYQKDIICYQEIKKSKLK